MGNVFAFDTGNVRNDMDISLIVWLDDDVKKKVENQKAQRRLRTIVHRLKTFEDEKECEKYIRSIAFKERLLLIVNDQQGREIVSRIHALQQVVSIYVYCKGQSSNEQWTKPFSKVKRVVKQLDDLIHRIRRDQGNSLLVDKVKPTRTHTLSRFAYSHFLSNILLQSKPIQTDKTKLISLCQHTCQNSESDFKILHEFAQTYSNHRTLWWYTRLTCFTQILNQALRTYDINTIFLFQFFIQDVHQRISEYQCQYPIRVYRTQLMIDEEINNFKVSVGSMISVQTFFSTVVDRDQAVSILTASEQSNGFHRVFFEINADPGVRPGRPFADITRYSYFPQEREVLFSIGSIFRITHVEQNDDQIWIIQMTLCGDGDADVKLLFDEMEGKYGSSDGEMVFIAFSRVLCEMKKSDEVEKYCQRLTRSCSVNEVVLEILYSEMAEIASYENDAELSEHWHQGSIEIKKKIESLNQTDDSKLISNNASFDYHPDGNHFRFLDVAAEQHHVLLPIEGHEKVPLVTLEETIEPLLSILPDIRRKAHAAKLNCKNPADGLTSDQSAAIMLYTMEWEPQEQCLYFALNARLRAADRKTLKPWFLYLKLILTGLARLPSIQRTVYRGVRLDLSADHQQGEQFFWWGFSSCTTTMNVLRLDQYLGNCGIRTLFHIECLNGKDIRRHSYYKQEDEILLLPATYFEVISSLEMAPDLHVIQLKEITSDFSYLEPVV